MARIVKLFKFEDISIEIKNQKIYICEDINLQTLMYILNTDLELVIISAEDDKIILDILDPLS